VFIVHLPLTPVESARTGAPGHVSDPPLKGARLLLVEDDPATRFAIARLLLNAGAVVATAADATEAMEEFARARPEAIVCDIGLPGADGYELIRRIRAAEAEAGNGHTPAVALTAFARDEDRRKALESGFQVHISKPPDADQLIKVLRGMMGG